jgi:hypothetical protein
LLVNTIDVALQLPTKSSMVSVSTAVGSDESPHPAAKTAPANRTKRERTVRSGHLHTTVAADRIVAGLSRRDETSRRVIGLMRRTGPPGRVTMKNREWRRTYRGAVIWP